MSGPLTIDDNLVLRCIECQHFFLPRELHVFVVRFREHGEARALPVEICPHCYDRIASAEVVDIKLEDMKRSYFITLTRHQYEQTIMAERWGMLYDEKTDKIMSRSLLAS